MYLHEQAIQSILFITDTQDVSRNYVDAMTEEGYKTFVRPKTSQQSSDSVVRDADLIIFESSKFSLEEITGLTQIRSIHNGLLALLVEQVDEMLQVMLYEYGVDALVIKPVQPLLMVAKIRALFRRNGRAKPPSKMIFKDFEIDPATRSVSYLGEEILFSSREFDLLWHLAQNASYTLDRDNLYRNVFGVEYNGYDRSVDMYISRIRSKLNHIANRQSLIKTVRGKGYLFASQ